jgi:hypothetical protein
LHFPFDDSTFVSFISEKTMAAEGTQIGRAEEGGKAVQKNMKEIFDGSRKFGRGGGGNNPMAKHESPSFICAFYSTQDWGEKAGEATGNPPSNSTSAKEQNFG